MALHKLAFSKICQDQRIWKYQGLSRNPHSEEFHGILRKREQAKGHLRTFF